mmetsp:Transcript_2793/g.7811  ORF Transcript_2793/g.7811 Transcript_2793/m.7811 type:complete len:198 (-) Transcript_2793:184-777(-)
MGTLVALVLLTALRSTRALTVNGPAASAIRASRPFFRHTTWVFTYSDVRPFDVQSSEVKLFLATNIMFPATGMTLASIGGDPTLGVLVDFAGAASMLYHFQQCSRGGTQRPTVQLAMLIDYLFAIPSLVLGVAYAMQLPCEVWPELGVVTGAGAIAALLGGWVCTKPIEYMVLHGLWHMLATAAGYQFALAHTPTVS